MTDQLINHYVELGVWRNETLWNIVEENLAQQPDRILLSDQSTTYTGSQLRARVLAVATHLHQIGLPPGAAVALQSGNSVDIAVCHLACNAAGLLFVPLSAAWRHREVSHLLALADVAVVIVPGAPDRTGFDYVAMINEMRSTLPHLVAVGASTPTDADVDFCLAALDGTAIETAQLPSHSPNQPSFVMATSGTTDLPKLSMWTDNDLWFFASAYFDAVHLRRDDIAFGIAPASTGSTGYCFPVLFPLMGGASAVLLEHWDPSAALRLLAESAATIATAIPTQIIKMLQDRSITDHDYSNLRAFTNAGAPMPPDAAADVDQRFGCAVQPLYGATDGGVPCMTSVDDPPEKRYRTVGRVIAHTEVRLIDSGGRDVPSGTAGEVLWRQPMKTSFGYLNDDARTSEAFTPDGFYRSGDLGQFDEDGYLRIVGRVKDIIIRGGQNISPREIEDLAITHPAIIEIAVIGVPDPVYGERACACVLLAAPLTLDELNQHLLEHRLAKFKLPERLEVFDSELPKSAGAKVAKAELRAIVAQRDAEAS